MAPRLQIVNGMHATSIGLRARRRRLRGTGLSVCILLIAVAIAPGDTARAAESRKHETLTVFAAASLRESFEQLRTEFHRQHPDVEIALTFGGSQDLRKRIEEGAHVDVFASADHRYMDMLIDKELVEAPAVFAHNELIIVVPKGNPSRIESVSDLRNAKRLVIGDESVPVGRYTLEMLTRASREIDPEFKTHVLDRVASRETDVRKVLAKVAAGEADAGIVYRTDAIAMLDKIDAVKIPRTENVIASYPIAVVRKSHAPETAAAFVQFVQSRAGQTVLARDGFQPEDLNVLPRASREPLRPQPYQPPVPD
jgi:molybdate transport system substrate-binding protein